tara:strand:+ start:1862 stop:3418 length:1557 start_codon:yes stop_codon:yes gene_type:complete
MAIIYSYPTDAAPSTGDLLLGSSSLDGNPTKTFSIASIAGLVNTAGGTGTVTNIATTNSTFITLQGGPITNAGTIVASLSAGGTPSNTTFLRGDNSWQPATSSGSPNISIFNQTDPITSAVTSINFTGLGVVTTGNGDDVTVNIAGTTSAVTGIIGGTGINASAATGDVEVSNTGVLSLVPGANITLSSTTGNVTINATNNPGTVQSVLPGNGLQLDSGSFTSSPTIGIEYSGSNNYILVGSSIDVPTVNDIIAFNQNSSSDIKTSTFDTIPIAALPLLQTYIDAGDANVVSNSSDTYTSTASVSNVTTLTQAQYTAIGVGNYDVNTLYVIATATALKTVRLTTVTNGIISTDGTGTGTGYTLTGNTGLPQSLTGVEGESYSFTVTATPDATHYFDPNNPVTNNVITGIFPAAATTDVTMTLAGTSLANPTPAVTATLQVVTNIQGGPSSAYTIGGNTTGAISTGTAPHTYTFATTISNPPSNSAYTWLVAPVIVNASGTIKGSQTVVTTITGTLQLT